MLSQYRHSYSTGLEWESYIKVKIQSQTHHADRHALCNERVQNIHTAIYKKYWNTKKLEKLKSRKRVKSVRVAIKRLGVDASRLRLTLPQSGRRGGTLQSRQLWSYWAPLIGCCCLYTTRLSLVYRHERRWRWNVILAANERLHMNCGALTSWHSCPMKLRF